MSHAAELGFDDRRLDRLRAALDADVAAQRYDGATMLVARGRTPVFAHTTGLAHRESGRALKADDVVVAFSVTKQFVHVLALAAVERGDLSLTGRVADVIPEFGCRGKENVTLAQLLTHTSGLPLKLPPMPDPMQLPNFDAVLAATCACAPDFAPGSRASYSGVVGVAVIAEMLRRVGGGAPKRVRDLLQQELFGPLGMKDTALGLRADLASRAVPVVARDRRPGVSMAEEYELFGLLVGHPEAEIPGLGAVSTAGDLMRFTHLMADGELEGHRLLSPAMIDLATREATPGMANDMMGYAVGMRGWSPLPATLGLGFWLRGDALVPTPFGTLASPRTYGALGAGSHMLWVDPARDVRVVFVSAGLVTDETRNIDRLQRLSDLVLSAVVH